eukprot:6474401-Amphidinium_carterae.1
MRFGAQQRRSMLLIAEWISFSCARVHVLQPEVIDAHWQVALVLGKTTFFCPSDSSAGVTLVRTEVSSTHEIPAKQRFLGQKEPKVGVCPVQWGAHDVAFRCLDCEYDSSCVQCVECFMKANHEGHDVKIIRTTGGTCDCGHALSTFTRSNTVTFGKLHMGVESSPHGKNFKCALLVIWLNPFGCERHVCTNENYYVQYYSLMGDPSSWDPAGFCKDHGEVQPHLDGPGALDLLPEDSFERHDHDKGNESWSLDELGHT